MREDACVPIQMSRGERSFTQNLLSLISSHLSKHSFLFSLCIYSPHRLLALLSLSRPQTALCAALLGQQQLSSTPPQSSRHNRVPLLTHVYDIMARFSHTSEAEHMSATKCSLVCLTFWSCTITRIQNMTEAGSGSGWIVWDGEQWWLKSCQRLRNKDKHWGDPHPVPTQNMKTHKHCNLHVHRGLGCVLLLPTGGLASSYYDKTNTGCCCLRLIPIQ